MHIIKLNLYIESKKVDYVYNIKKRIRGWWNYYDW